LEKPPKSKRTKEGQKGYTEHARQTRKPRTGLVRKKKSMGGGRRKREDILGGEWLSYGDE